MKYLFIFFLLITGSIIANNKTHQPGNALQELMAGNQRFVEGTATCPNQSEARRLQTAELQKPFAVILGCSDSRVAPEIIFDQGIGDLFIVRVAGNVAGSTEIDSIEYALLQLNACFVLVLGHSNCGAVSAVLSGNVDDIDAVASLISPAFKNQTLSLKEATIANVKQQIAYLKESRVIKRVIQEKKCDIKGGYYDFVTGKVEIIE